MKRSYKSLEMECNAALKSCAVIAKSLGIAGASQGEIIAQVHRLVGENAVLMAGVSNISHCCGTLYENQVMVSAMETIQGIIQEVIESSRTSITTQALNEFKAQGVEEFANSKRRQAVKMNIKGNKSVRNMANRVAYDAEAFAASMRWQHHG